MKHSHLNKEWHNINHHDPESALDSPIILQSLQNLPHDGTIINIGGDGYDAIAFKALAPSSGLTINIGTDSEEYKKSEVQYGSDFIIKAETSDDLDTTINIAQQVVFVQDDITSLETFNDVAPGVKGDLVVANNVMTFIPAEDHAKALHNMSNITKEDDGVAIIRYRKTGLSENEIDIDEFQLMKQAFDAGFTRVGLADWQHHDSSDSSGWQTIIMSKDPAKRNDISPPTIEPPYREDEKRPPSKRSGREGPTSPTM